MKKTLALLLALTMVLSMAACGGNNSTATTAAATTAPAENAPAATDAADGYTGPDWAAIDAMDADEASDAIYDWNLGEFNTVYQDA